MPYKKFSYISSTPDKLKFQIKGPDPFKLLPSQWASDKDMPFSLHMYSYSHSLDTIGIGIDLLFKIEFNLN